MCPNNEEHKKGQSKGFEKGGSNQVRMLSAIRHVTPGVETRNRYQVLQEDDREDKEETMYELGGSGTAQEAEDTSRGEGQRKRRWGGRLGVLREIVPDSVNSMEEQEWEEINMAVDSGATETVVGEDMLTSVETKEGSAY